MGRGSPPNHLRQQLAPSWLKRDTVRTSILFPSTVIVYFADVANIRGRPYSDVDDASLLHNSTSGRLIALYSVAFWSHISVPYATPCQSKKRYWVSEHQFQRFTFDDHLKVHLWKLLKNGILSSKRFWCVCARISYGEFSMRFLSLVDRAPCVHRQLDDLSPSKFHHQRSVSTSSLHRLVSDDRIPQEILVMSFFNSPINVEDSLLAHKIRGLVKRGDEIQYLETL